MASGAKGISSEALTALLLQNEDILLPTTPVHTILAPGFWKDVKILLKTIPAIIGGKGAY